MDKPGRPEGIPDRGPRAQKDPVGALKWSSEKVDRLLSDREKMLTRIAYLEALLKQHGVCSCSCHDPAAGPTMHTFPCC